MLIERLAACAAAIIVLCQGSSLAAGPGGQPELPDDRDFKIDYIYFAGTPARYLRRTLSLRSADMQPGEQSELRKLINTSHLLTVDESKLMVTDGGPSRSITLSTGAVSRKVSWSYEYAPEALRRLDSYLFSRSREERKP